jgi:hypothetical protein
MLRLRSYTAFAVAPQASAKLGGRPLKPISAMN